MTETLAINEQVALANLLISGDLATAFLQSFKADFFKNLIEQIESEQKFLENDKERYLEFMSGSTLLSRIVDFDFSGSVAEIYQKANSPTSPIRNGMLLFGLYTSTVICDN